MKVLFKIISGLLMGMSLVNCKVSGNGSGSWTITEDDSYQRVSSEMSYFHGGWYPGPNRPNWDLSMVLKYESANKISAVVKTPDCKVSTTISQAQYIELEKMILKSTRKTDKLQRIDGGDETITLRIGDLEHKEYLKSGDSTYNKLVIVPEEAKKIGIKIDEIAEAALKRFPCDAVGFNFNIIAATLRENVSPHASAPMADMEPTQLYRPNPENLTYTDLHFEISSQGVVVTGYEQKVQSHQTCVRKFSNTLVKDNQLKEAIKKIRIVKVDNICYMAAQYPGYQKSLQLDYTDVPSDIGYFNCMAVNRVENGDEFLKRVASLLESVKPTCYMR